MAAPECKGFPYQPRSQQSGACRKSLLYFTAACLLRILLRASLLGREVADNWELKLFIVVGFKHHKKPATEHCETDQQTNQADQSPHSQSGSKQHADNYKTPNHPKTKARNPEKDRLKSVETHKTVVF